MEKSSRGSWVYFLLAGDRIHACLNVGRCEDPLSVERSSTGREIKTDKKIGHSWGEFAMVGRFFTERKII